MSDKLWAREEYVQCEGDTRYSLGDSGVYETWTDDTGKLYRSLQHEYGRCIGKMYIDRKDSAIAIGWVFLKRMQYSDCKETYLQETWVSLHNGPPVKTVEYNYHSIGGL